MLNICVFYFRVTVDFFQSFILSKCPLIGRFREYCSFLFSLTVCSHASSFQLIKKNNNGLKALAHNSIVVSIIITPLFIYVNISLTIFIYFVLMFGFYAVFLAFFLFFTFKCSDFS